MMGDKIENDDLNYLVNNDKNDYILSFDISVDDDIDKYVKNIKTLVRRSFEYKNFVDFIKNTLGYDYCQFTKEVNSEVTIDLHHHPISLENLVSIVLETNLMKGKQVTTFDIAKEVMDLHYRNKVGYVLLLKSLHEKFHNGYLEIPIDFVHGDYKYILDNYYVNDDIRKVIEKYESIKLDENKPFSYSWTRGSYILYQDER